MDFSTESPLLPQTVLPPADDKQQMWFYYYTLHIFPQRESQARVCVRETGWRRGNTQLVVLQAEMLKSAKAFCIQRVFLPFTAAFTEHSLDAGKCRAAVIGLRAHTNTQVTGKQNCQDDGTKPVKALSWDLKPRANTLSWVNARQAESNEIFSHVAG